MKKILIKLLALAICAVTLFAFTGCAEIENGSKIERMIITLDFYDASGNVVDSTDVEIKLYTTYAPETTAHFKSLAEQGFYNGTCVSNVTSSFFEIGGYKYDDNGAFVENPYTGSLLKGEFAKNGWVGNKLTVTAGAIVMKRDYDNAKTGSSKYDTAKGTVIICTGAASTFASDKYCVFGMVEATDAKDPENSASDIALDDKSSIDKLKTVADYKSQEIDDQTVTTLYHETSKKFYTKWQDGEGTHYCEGTEVNVDAEIVDTALEDFQELLSEDKNAFLTIPYVKIVINSIKAA